MKLLAIDSSGLVASVAVLEDDTVLGEYSTNFKKTHSQTLLPMISELKSMLGLDMNSIDAIAVAGGPGSFTGLRIGSATAKGLGLALDKPLVSVPTVDAMAYQLYGTKGLICPILDARRAQVYTGIYTFEEDTFTIVEAQQAISIQELIEKLNTLGQPVTFLGDGVPVHKEILKETLQVPVYFAPSFASRQRAAALGALAVEYIKEGKIEAAKDHKPDYLRLSQAERERLEKEEKEKQQAGKVKPID